MKTKQPKPDAVPLAALHLNDGSHGLPKNPRFIRDDRFAALVASVRDNPEFMPARPIIVDEAGVILGGNMRYRACIELKMKTVPASWVQRVAGWSVEKKRRFIILDNRGFGEDDFDLLANEWELDELIAAGFDEKELTGSGAFDEEGDADAEPQVDRAEELQEKWKTERGQLWAIGEHRLLCGDSTKAADVARLMGGDKAACVLTDPPYGQNQNGVENDAPEVHTDLMLAAVSALPITDGVVVAFQSPRTFHAWTDAARVKGFTFERMLWLYKAAQCTFPWRGWILKSESIPVCSIGRPGWQDVHPFSHDCYYLSEVSGELKPESGWHGSVKPLSVVQDLLARICAKGATCFDGFAGSGTTLAACQNLGRVGCAIEQHPPACAVILERMITAFPDIDIHKVQ